MYIRAEQVRDALHTHKSTARVSGFHLYNSSLSSIDEIGQPVPNPILLKHYHIEKLRDAGGILRPNPTVSAMTVAQMKPGYVPITDPRRVNLQREVESLILGKYAAAVTPTVQLRIALVDLTEIKFNTPIFGGFWSFNANKPEDPAVMEGGSLTKILALYAVYQLRFDLNTIAKTMGITKGNELQSFITREWEMAGLLRPSQPRLTSLFQFVERAGSPVEARLLQTPSIHANIKARHLILRLGFEYMGSVALQSGLFDDRQGGLWLNAAYQKPAITWRNSPFPNVPRHSATALSVATFFTLLAQGRLVDQAASNKIAHVLKQVQCFKNGLLDGIKQFPGAPAGVSSNKCGLLRPHYHEGIHVSRHPIGGKRFEYVAVVLSKVPPPLSFVELGKDLDNIIERQNP